MIRDALSVLPTKPVVYIAPLIVVVVLSLYYWDQYRTCTHIQQFRQSLNQVLLEHNRDRSLRLADVTNFGWDQVRIVENFVPEYDHGACPAGWNWARGLRETLMASGRLTVLIFGQEGAIVAYRELRSDEVAFSSADVSLTPDTANFMVTRGSTGGDGVKLTLQP